METVESLAVIIFLMCNLWRVDSSEPCSFMVNGSSGKINLNSSFIIENYCSWLIAAPPHHNIILNFTTLNILNYSNFKPSSVEVYDGRNKSQTLLGYYTGNKNPFILQSSGRYILVVATGVSSFTAIYTSRTRKAKPRVVIPLRVVRTVSEQYVWCSSEGTPPINISLINSSTTLAFGKEKVWSKLNQDGNYTCIATNEVGSESKTFYVSLIDFGVCVDLCDCHSYTYESRIRNIFRCSGKYSIHILNNIPTTTTRLRLHNNEIIQLPENVFSGLTSLQKLELDKNKIIQLPEKAFSGLTHLEDLVLQNNEITQLSENVFSGLSSLEELLLDNNKIIQLPEKVFSGLTILKELELAKNKISQLPEKVFAGVTSLQKLSLSYNEIIQFPEKVFSGLTNLLSLRLENNKIIELPEEIFSGLTSLDILWLHNNGINRLPGDVFSGLTSLRLLSLRNNKIVELPENVFSGLTNMRYLFLQNNFITFLTNESFGKLENLKYLLLSGNKLQRIPDGTFRNLKDLRLIMLSDNPINTVGERVFTIQNRNLAIYFIRTKLRTFDLGSFDNINNITGVITFYEDKISTIKFKQDCIVHLGAAKGDSDFIDISDADSQVQQLLREVLLWAGFANNFDKTGLKLLPCPPGTFVNISDSIPRCIDCPAGGYYSDSVASVSDSCLRCPNGTFVDKTKAPGKSARDCIACPQGTDTKSFAGFRACYCLKGFFRRHKFDDCEPCEQRDGLRCENDAVTLQPGYWWKWENDTNKEHYKSFSNLLHTNSSVENQSIIEYPHSLPQPYKCRRPESCLGGIDSTCFVGYEGPLCEVCSRGYYKQLKICKECPTKTWMIAQLSVIAAVTILITVVVVWKGRKQTNNKQDRSLVDIILGRLKIVIGFYQVTFGVLDAFAYLKWPDSLSLIGKYSEMLQLNIFQIAPIHCLFPDLKVNAFGSLFTVLGVNAAVVIFTFITYGIRKVILTRKTFPSQVEKVKKISETKQLAYRTVFFFLYVTYLSTCSKTANVLPLACHKLCLDEKGDKCDTFLKVDFNVKCSNQEFRRSVIVAYCSILYIIFLPVAAFVVLWRHQRSVKIHPEGGDDESTNSQLSNPEIVTGLQFLFANYNIQSWYWELVETARKVTLTSGIILIGGESRAYVGLACVLSGLYGMFFAYKRPIAEPFENNLMVSSLAVTFVNLGIGAVSRIPAEGAQSLVDSYMDHIMFKALVFGANFLVIGILVVQYVIYICRFIKEWRKNPQWSLSCCLALVLPLNDLQNEIRGMTGKNFLKQQVQTGKFNMPSVSSTLKESGAVSFELVSIHEQPKNSLEPRSVNFGFEERENGGPEEDEEEDDADKVAFDTRKKPDHVANPKAMFDAHF